MKYWKLSAGFFLLVAILIPVYAWKVDDKVMYQWDAGDGSWWYAAKVTYVNSNGTFDLTANGYQQPSSPKKLIKAINWKVGTKLQCQKGRPDPSAKEYLPGTITTKTGDTIHIKYDSGDEEDTDIIYCRSK